VALDPKKADELSHNGVTVFNGVRYWHELASPTLTPDVWYDRGRNLQTGSSDRRLVD